MLTLIIDGDLEELYSLSIKLSIDG